MIGTGPLGLWNDDSATVSGVTGYPCGMPFTIKDVPHEGRYGFAINGIPGTIWESSVRGTVSLTASGFFIGRE